MRPAVEVKESLGLGTTSGGLLPFGRTGPCLFPSNWGFSLQPWIFREDGEQPGDDFGRSHSTLTHSGGTALSEQLPAVLCVLWVMPGS